MKTKKDRENEKLSIFCGALVFSLVVFFVLLGAVINLAIDNINTKIEQDYVDAKAKIDQHNMGL